MKVWIDAQLPPQLAPWLRTQFGLEAVALRDLGLRDADDDAIFQAARAAEAVLISKDADFVALVTRLGAPPQLLWVTCGNVTNRRLREVLAALLPAALELLRAGRDVVELADARRTET